MPEISVRAADTLFSYYVYIYEDGDEISLVFQPDDTEDSSKTVLEGPWEVSSATTSSSGFEWRSSEYLTEITSVVFTEGSSYYAPVNCSNLFNGMTSLLSVSNGELFDTSNTTKLAYAFYKCTSITSLSFLSTWDVSNVTTFEYLFYGMTGLTSLDGVEAWDTGSVTTLHSVFRSCTNLTDISAVKNWDTSNVTTLYAFLNSCTSLTTLSGLEDWDTSKNGGLGYAFAICSKLSDISALASWDVSSVTNMEWMFASDSKIKDISALANWQTDSLTSLYATFRYCGMTDASALSNWNVSKVTNFQQTFWSCTGLTSLSLDNWDMSSAKYTIQMFGECYYLTEISGTENWTLENVTQASSMFSNCKALKSLDLSSWTVSSSLTTCASMFNSCGKLESLNLSSAVISSSATGSGMFSGCSSLKEITMNADFVFPSDSRFETYCIPSYSHSDEIGDEDGEYTGNWTHTDARNHTASITVSELVEYYDDGTATTTLTWYWEVNGDDPGLQYYVSVTENYYDPDEWTDEDGNVTSPEDAFPSTEYDGYWIKIDDNTYKYVFYVYDDDTDWYVWEGLIDGYTADYTDYIIVYSEDEKTVTITNTQETDLTYGSLSITKYVYDEEGNDITDSASFTFPVTLTDADGNALSGTAIYGDTAFKDGTATVSVSDDETITFTDIPAGYLYTITESSLVGYTFASITNASGEITTDTTAEVICINTKEDDSDTQYVSFTLEKQISGIYQSDDTEYTFYVTLSGLAGSTEYTLSYSDGTTDTFTSNSSGSATLTITLAAGEYVTVQNIPEGAKYSVTEAAGDYTASFKITDANNLGLINTMAGANDSEDTALSTGSETADAGEDVTVTFTNELYHTEDLVISKTVTDSSGNEIFDTTQFGITLYLEGLEANTKYYTTAGYITSDEDGTYTGTFMLSGGESVTLKAIPVGTTYYATEAFTKYIASYEITDTNGLQKTQSGENEEQYTSLSTETETLNEGEAVTIAFTNLKPDVPVQFVKQNEDDEAIGPAEYELYSSDGELIATIVMDETGYSKTIDLETGDYYLIETVAPSGYFLTEGKIEFSITDDDLLEGLITFVITDDEIMVLPSTGGIGRKIIVILLLISVVFVVAVFSNRKHKRHILVN